MGIDDTEVASACRAKSGRGEEAEGGEEAIPAAEAQLSTDRRGAEREESTSL